MDTKVTKVTRKKNCEINTDTMENSTAEKAGGKSREPQENTITWTETAVQVTDIQQFRAHTSKGPHTGKSHRGMLYYIRRNSSLMLPKTLEPDTDSEWLKKQIAKGLIYTHASYLDYEKWCADFPWLVGESK